MMLPSVHLNGTSKSELFTMHMAALEAIREAETALAKTAPNGRDFYVQGPGATSDAMNEHRARMVKLADVHKELETILEHLDDA